MQEFALETQGVIGVGRLLLNHPVTGSNRFEQRTALDLFVNLAQNVFFESRLDQPDFQLLGGERLDQIIVRGQFSHRHDVGVATLAGDDQINGGQRNQVGVAQFFQQLLAVTPVIQHKVGENNVETIALDLTDHLSGISRPMHGGNAER